MGFGGLRSHQNYQATSVGGSNYIFIGMQVVVSTTNVTLRTTKVTKLKFYLNIAYFAKNCNKIICGFREQCVNRAQCLLYSVIHVYKQYKLLFINLNILFMGPFELLLKKKQKAKNINEVSPESKCHLTKVQKDKLMI